jgi:hypothetical protein
MHNDNFNFDLLKYYRCQTDICFNSQLFGDQITLHGSKVLMLFAEIYAFLVNDAKLNVDHNFFIAFENSINFKNWFWTIKHRLGIELQNDPSFFDIGKWIGQGFFFKIIFNLIIDNPLKFDITNNSKIFDNAIQKQKNILNNFLTKNYFIKPDKPAIEMLQDGYTLLNEKVILDQNNKLFYLTNQIK